jgi:hypothetical protein
MPAMTLEGIAALGADARNTLHTNGTVRVEYQPGNGTRYDIVIVNYAEQVGPARHEYPDHWIVCVLNFGTSYEFPVGAPMASYLADKLTLKNDTDGAALHLLLAAISGDDCHYDLRAAGISP